MMDNETQTHIEAAVFRKLLKHLDEHKEVQNIDLMLLADFCRNCLSKWYVTAAEEEGVSLELEQAHQAVYGMDYAEWKSLHQQPATPEQLAALETKRK